MNDLSKILSRLFTAIASLEKFISKRKVIHIILTFCRENGANTTFLIKSHDTKKVEITKKVFPYYLQCLKGLFCQRIAKEKRRNPATLQELYVDENEGTLFPRPVIVGFFYAFCSSRHDF